MNINLKRIRSPFLPAGLLLAVVAAAFHLFLGPVRNFAGPAGHLVFALLLAFPTTVVLWTTLERARIVPPSLRFQLWLQEEWDPSRTYGVLWRILLAALVAWGILRGLGESAFAGIPLLVAAVDAVFLCFYWFLRKGVVYLVVGILTLLLGLVQFGLIVSFFLTGAVASMDVRPQVYLGLGLGTYALLFVGTGALLIRKWKHPADRIGSWRQFGWGYLAVMTMTLAAAPPDLVATTSVSILSPYFFVYAMARLTASLFRRPAPESLSIYVRHPGVLSFLLFSIADRSRWGPEAERFQKGGATLISVSQSLFVLIMLGAALVTIYGFVNVPPPLQASVALLIVAFHISFSLSTYHAATNDVVLQERIRLEEELRAAHDMQMGLMPKEDPVVKGFDIASACFPANEVGGDFYDFVWLDAKHIRLGIAVADVSGKAMKAAMTAVLTSGMLYSEVQKSRSPREVLSRINRPLYLRSDRKVFTAMAFGMLNLKTKTLVYSSAGQVPPVLIRRGLSKDMTVAGVRLPLGIKDSLTYHELTVKLKKRDLLVFCTDGIVEAMNERKEMFGFDRMRECLVRWADLPAAQVRDRLLKEVRQHAGTAPQHDDMTVVVVHVV